MGKRISLSVIMHANMQYDRFGRDEILDKFPRMYRYILRSVETHPEMRIGFEQSGATILMLKRHAPDVLDGIRDAVAARRAIVLGTYFSNPLNMCVDEHFNFWNAWLGVEIVRREIGEPSGFYAQENSYHPGMPSVVRKLGLTWMTVPSLAARQPFSARGLTGETITGVPTEVVDAENLERLYAEYPDDAIIVPIVDCEYHPNFEAFTAKIALMREAGRRIEWTSVPEYLARSAPGESLDILPCTSADTLYARWTTSPENVRLHELTMESIRLYHDAVALRDMIRVEYHEDIDVPYRDSVVTRERNVITAGIEDLSCLPDVAVEYLSESKEVSTLTHAFSLLLWATNSDARGWYPLVQKTLQRRDDFAHAAALCREVIDRGLRLLKGRKGLSDTDSKVVYNPHRARGFELRLRGERALVFEGVARGDALNLKSAEGVETTARIAGSGNSVQVLTYRPAPDCDRFTWQAGSAIQNGSSELSLQDYSLHYTCGARTMTLFLSLPAFVEVKNGTIELDVIKHFSYRPIFTETGRRLDPCMRIGRKINESIYVTELYTLKGDRLECAWDLFFPRDVILGNLTWETAQIEAVVTGGFKRIHGNIPGGVYGYPFRSGRITALTYAIGVADDGGAALVSLSGSQGFRLDGQRGELAVGLGASTLGPSSVPALMTVDPDLSNGSGIYQFEKFGYVTFHGTYRHRFVILPFTGGYAASGIEARAELCDKNVYVS